MKPASEGRVDYQGYIAQALRGDEDAYRWLHDQLLPWAVTRWMRFPRLRHENNAPEDATTHVLMRIRQFQGRSAFTTWAIAVMDNCYRQMMRSRWNWMDIESLNTSVTQIEDEERREWLPSPTNHHAQVEANMDLNAHICRLPPSFRDALVLRDFYGYDVKDGIPGHTKTASCRARKRIREGFYASCPSGDFQLPPMVI